MTSTLSPVAAPKQPTLDPLVTANPTDTPEVSLITVVVVLLRHRWLIVLMGLLFFIMFSFQNYNPVPSYTATATFTPRQRSQISSSSAILQQLGLGGGSSGGSAYYLELIRSREILGPVVEARYSFKEGNRTISGTLIELYGIRDPRPRYARANAIRILASHMRTTSSSTGMMQLSVTEGSPGLAPLLVERVLQELNRFNLESRQKEASGERRFIENQMEEAGIRLRIMEDMLQRFLSENQNFSEISPLSFEWDRLKRQVAMRQEMYTAFAKQLDQARIEEVRDSPVLSVLEPAEIPLGPDPAVWRQKALLGAGFGMMLGILISFIHAYFVRRKEEETDEYEELTHLKKQVKDDIKHIWRPVGRILATGRP